MATIIPRTVNGSGHYAYRADYVDGRHKWTYLGPVDELDLDDLDTDDVEQSTLDDVAEFIVEERDDQKRVDRDPVDVEFHDRGAANELRSRIANEHLAEDDDRRSKTVLLADDAPLATQNLAAGAAADSKAHVADKGGQKPLTETEKDRIDFTRTNVMHARSVKGRLQNGGVDDWLAFYDPTLEVEEHDPEAARRDESGARSDADDTEGAQLKREAEAFRKAESEAEDHARGLHQRTQGSVPGVEATRMDRRGDP